MRSAASWGIGDLDDLRTIAEWSAREHAADFVLVNPVHAAEIVAPMTASPYLPTTRRFANPVYLRVERIPEFADLPVAAREAIAAAAAQVRADSGDLIDRDRSWAAKRAALAQVHAVARTPEQEQAFRELLLRARAPNWTASPPGAS